MTGGWPVRATADAFERLRRDHGRRARRPRPHLDDPQRAVVLGLPRLRPGRARARSARAGRRARRRAPPQPRARARGAGAARDLDGRPRLLDHAQLPRAARARATARPRRCAASTRLANRAFTHAAAEGRVPGGSARGHGIRHRLVVRAATATSRRSTSRSTCSGVNYYSTATVRLWDGVSPKQHERRAQGARAAARPGPAATGVVEFLEQPGPYTAMGWNIAPEGLEELLLSLQGAVPAISRS